MVVLAIASSIKLGCHTLGTSHDSNKLLHPASVAVPLTDVRTHAKPARVSLNQADIAVGQQSLHALELLRTRTPRVSVDEVLSVSELMPVQRNAELDMLCGLPFLLVERSKPLRIIWMYVFIQFLKITK